MKKYNKYKHSGIEWIGEIPEHWEVKRLGANFIERTQKVSDKDYRPLSVTKKGIVFQIETAAKSNDGDNRKLVKKGDFVINSRSDRKGSSGLSLYDGSVSLINIVLQLNQINSIFSHYLLKSYGFAEEFYKNGHGIVADLWTTRFWDMKTIKIPIPPLDEQKAIANFLDKKTAQINKAINQKEKLIKLLKEQKQTIINTAVTKGLNKNAKLTNSGIEWIGEIPEHWEASKLKFVTKKIIDGTHFTPDYQDNGIVFLRVTDLQNKTIDLTKTKYISKEEHTELSKRCKAEKGDLLLSKNGTIGLTRVVDWDFEFSIFVSLCLIKINHNILIPKILEYQIRSEIFTQQLLEAGKTTSVTNLHLEMIKELKVLIPPLDIQVKIVKFLDAKTTQIDKAINLQTNYIEKLKEYKTSLIDSVVTGKVKIGDKG